MGAAASRFKGAPGEFFSSAPPCCLTISLELHQQTPCIVGTRVLWLVLDFSDERANFFLALSQPLLHLFDIGNFAAQNIRQLATPPMGEIRGQYLPDLIQRKTGSLRADDDAQNDERAGRIFAISVGFSGNGVEQPFGLIKTNARSRQSASPRQLADFHDRSLD